MLALSIGYSGDEGLRAYMLLGFACGFVVYAAGLHRLFSAIGRQLGRLFAPMRQAHAKRREKRKEKFQQKKDLQRKCRSWDIIS